MTTREYTCPSDGMFFVKRPISAPLEEKCPKCQKEATRSYLSGKFPLWGITGDGIPNDSKDERGYEEWQRNRWSALEAECHVDNMGTGDVDATKIVPKHRFGQDK